jgi:protein-disulfide isomerase
MRDIMAKHGLLIGLLALTAVMQGVILYRQPRVPKPPKVTANAPKNLHLDIVDYPAKGSPNAKAVIIEFSDYECPFCARHATTVLPQLMKDFVEQGRLRYVFANNPLQMHPNARLLAGIAICAGKQGRYWEAHDLLFAKNREPEVVASELGGEMRLDGTALEECVDGKTNDQIIRRDQELAQRLGFRSTPAFAVGRVVEGTRVELLKTITGAVAADVFVEVIDDVLKRAERG